MLDPISAAAAASSAFAAIKKGFEIGRDLESMAGDLSRWMSAISDITEAEKQAQNPPLFKKLLFSGSVEEEAVQMFAAKKKAEQQREDLKVYIQYTMGQSAWDELIKMEGHIRKRRQETIYKQAQLRKKFVEYLAYFLTFCVAAGLLTLLILTLKAMQG